MRLLFILIPLLFASTFALDLQFDAFEYGEEVQQDYSDNRFGFQTRYTSVMTNFKDTRVGLKPSIKMAGVEIGAVFEYVHGDAGSARRSYIIDDSNFLHWTPFIKNGTWLWYQFSLDENANIEVRVGIELFKNQTN